ncbi:MAG: topoisomerase C-terminal repeat-containing protein, partial [Acidimicrobiales bacterium]
DGRPSTYASILQTIQDRGYVWRKGTALVPSFTAFAVVTLLEQHFPNLVDYGFTASMEDDLDEIASGSEEQIPWLERFYFGESRHLERFGVLDGQADSTVEAKVRQPRHALAVDGKRGLKDAVLTHLEEIDAREVNSISIGADENGEEIVVRVGRYGPYLQRGEDRAPVPDELAPDELTTERAMELLASPSGDRLLGTDPESGKPVYARAGRFGPYVQLGEVGGDDKDKPRTASLFSSMSPESVTFEDAMRLLQLPRILGVDPVSGAEVVASNGRYGPYLKCGNDTRSLDSEEQLFEVTLDDALARLAQPKTRRYGQAASPLREIGTDPVSGQPIALRSGRFGPYVTDGTVNASLRRDDDPETITQERASELLQMRREAGPSTRKKAAAKKAPAKRASAAKKPAAKKAPGSVKAAPVAARGLPTPAESPRE